MKLESKVKRNGKKFKSAGLFLPYTFVIKLGAMKRLKVRRIETTQNVVIGYMIGLFFFHFSLTLLPYFVMFEANKSIKNQKCTLSIYSKVLCDALHTLKIFWYDWEVICHNGELCDDQTNST